METPFWEIIGPCPPSANNSGPAYRVFSFVLANLTNRDVLIDLLSAFTVEDFQKDPSALVALLSTTKSLRNNPHRIALVENIREAWVARFTTDEWLDRLGRGD